MACFFFFKQKTAYEMRISDWSSDVCSSDLKGTGTGDAAGAAARCQGRGGGCGRRAGGGDLSREPSASIIENLTQRREGAKEEEGAHTKTQRCRCKPRHRALTRPWLSDLRSEEHTSELQSLMRISYAVFCLKKKT